MKLWVIYFAEKKPLRMNRFTGCAPLLSCNNGFKFFGWYGALTNLKHSSYDGAHHISQKPICRNGKHHALVFSFPLCKFNIAIVGIGLGSAFAKCRKILFAEQTFTCLIHQIDIQDPIMINRIMIFKWIFLKMHIVLIRSVGSSKTCMHMFFCCKAIFYGNINR